MNKIELLKRLDAVAGFLLCRLLPRANGNDRGAVVRRILIIRPGGIGDAVLLAPTIKALKKKFPEAEITILAENRNASIFHLIPDIDQVLRYDVPKELVTAFHLKPDLTIDTEQYHRLSAVVARLIGATTFIGFDTNKRARLFHHAIPYSHDDYETDSFFHLLTPLDISPPAKLDLPFLSVSAAIRARAAELLAPLAGQPFVTLFSGASIPERRWDRECFEQVATHLNRHNYQIVVVGGREDSATGAAIARAVGGLNLAGQTTLAETAAILAQSALLISGDSGVLHLGVGLGIPTISLFGPGIAAKWAPPGPRHIVLNQHLPCSPCTRFGYTPKCIRQGECLRLITVDAVLDAAMSLLR